MNNSNPADDNKPIAGGQLRSTQHPMAPPFNPVIVSIPARPGVSPIPAITVGVPPILDELPSSVKQLGEGNATQAARSGGGETEELRQRAWEKLNARFQSVRVMMSGGIPPTPAQLKIGDLHMSAGVYLFAGKTGGGKSVLTSALVHYFKRARIDASYLSVFEPRSRVIANSEATTKGESNFFERPALFISDLTEVLNRTRPVQVDPTKALPLGLLVVDSITIPLKSVDDKAYRGQSTFPGGIQPSDLAFLTQLAQIALRFDLVIVATVNTDLLAYAPYLAGVTEGYLRTANFGTIEVSDRGSTSGREYIPFTIPDLDLQAALFAWKLGKLRKTTPIEGTDRSSL